jgi:hypothetical protein
MIAAIEAQLPLIQIVLAGTLVVAAIWASAGFWARWARDVLRGLAVMAVCMAAFFLGASFAARAGCRAARRVPVWLYCHKPWLCVLNLAEKRARRKIGMPKGHPERIACFYRKDGWRVLQRQLWPAREWVEEIEADMRMRGWLQP